jgi:putrescine---pyruvate transaminase
MTVQGNSDAWKKDRVHLLHPYTDFATFKKDGSQVIAEADGMHVVVEAGRRYLDGIAGLWCVNIGHGRREMAEAISDQVLRMQYWTCRGLMPLL